MITIDELGGPLVLQDHDPAREVKDRRIVGVSRVHAPDLDTYNPTPASSGGTVTFGDLRGGFFWEEEKGQRGLHSWWLSGPGIVNLGDGTAGGWRPIQLEGAQPDLRYKRKSPARPAWVRGNMPTGWTALASEGTEEKSQQESLHPDFWGLIAVNKDGDPTTGSHVYDELADASPDPNRWARLQSLVTVLDMTPGAVACGVTGRGLALNLGRGGRKDGGPGYLLLADHDHREVGIGSGCSGRPGPLTLGDGSCQHNLGTDADGKVVRPAHNHVNTLHIRPELGQDGPMEFDFLPWETTEEPSGPWHEVRLRFDRERFHTVCGRPYAGKWAWEVQIPITTIIGDPPPPPPPPPPEPPPPYPPPPQPPPPPPEPPPYPPPPEPPPPPQPPPPFVQPPPETEGGIGFIGDSVLSFSEGAGPLLDGTPIGVLPGGVGTGLAGLDLGAGPLLGGAPIGTGLNLSDLGAGPFLSGAPIPGSQLGSGSEGFLQRFLRTVSQKAFVGQDQRNTQAATWLPLAVPQLEFKATPTVRGEVNYLASPSLPAYDQWQFKYASPVTAALASYAIGDGTQQGYSLLTQGTRTSHPYATGGLTLVGPGSSLSYLLEGQGQAPLSAVTLAVPENHGQIHFGNPSRGVASGGRGAGVSLTYSGADSDLKFTYTDATGAVVDSILLSDLGGGATGDITAVNTTGPGITGGATSGAVTLNLQAYLQDIAGLTLSKGDLLVFDGTDVNRLAVGTDGDVLTADSGEATGLLWTAGGGGGGGDITSVGVTGPAITGGGTTGAVTIGAHANLQGIAAVTASDSVFLVGDGSTFVGESGATARTSMGAQASHANLTALASTSLAADELLYVNGAGTLSSDGISTALDELLGVASGDRPLIRTGGSWQAPAAGDRTLFGTNSSSVFTQHTSANRQHFLRDSGGTFGFTGKLDLTGTNATVGGFAELETTANAGSGSYQLNLDMTTSAGTSSGAEAFLALKLDGATLNVFKIRKVADGGHDAFFLNISGTSSQFYFDDSQDSIFIGHKLEMPEQAAPSTPGTGKSFVYIPSSGAGQGSIGVKKDTGVTFYAPTPQTKPTGASTTGVTFSAASGNPADLTQAVTKADFDAAIAALNTQKTDINNAVGVLNNVNDGVAAAAVFV